MTSDPPFTKSSYNLPVRTKYKIVTGKIVKHFTKKKGILITNKHMNIF